MRWFARKSSRTPIAGRRWLPSWSAPWCGVILAISLAAASPADVLDYTYVTNGLEITITGYTCSPSNTVAVIPDTIDGLPVTRIGERAFEACYDVTSVTIPNSVTNIGERAFQYCQTLTSVTIPGSVTNIGAEAFRLCESLSNITIPNSVTNIGMSAFSSCRALSSVTIPDSVTTIGSRAFNYCSALTSITIPDSVTSIGEVAFSRCDALTSITVTAGNPVYSDSNGVLFNLDKTILIIYPAGRPGSYSIPTSVTRIGRNAFYSCRVLTSVTIPDSVTSIGDGAFGYCESLSSVTIPDSVTRIGQNAFYSCRVLTSVTIPASVTGIGAWAFHQCSALTSITIPESVAYVGVNAFLACGSLTSITVQAENTVYSDLDGVLFSVDKAILLAYPAGRTGGYSVPNSVTSIQDWAFNRCDALTSVSIEDGVTNIGSVAFSFSDALTSVTIPGSVTIIGTGAFRSCDALTSVYFTGDAPTIDDGVFQSSPPTIYYLAGTTGWDATFAERPTALYTWPELVDIQTGDPPGLDVAGTPNMEVRVSACTDLINPVWIDVGTVLLNSGTNTVVDLDSTNHASRIYRVLPYQGP